MTSTRLPDIAVEFWVAADDGWFTLDVSELDGPDELGQFTGAPDEWFDARCDVESISIDRGASRWIGPLTRSEAGVATISIRDRHGVYDPVVNPDAVHHGTPVRVRAIDDYDPPAWSAVLFTGTVVTPQIKYRRHAPSQVTIRAVDGIGTMAAYKQRPYDVEVGTGEDLLGRAKRVLRQVQQEVQIAADSDTAYTAELAGTLFRGDAWSELSDAQDAELGRMWVDRDNRVVVRGRDSLLTGIVRGTLSDDVREHDDPPSVFGPHCCYVDPTLTLGVESLANRVVAQRQWPSTEEPVKFPWWLQLDNDYSQRRYGLVAYENRNVLLTTDTQVGEFATALLLAADAPSLRVDSIQPAPPTPEAWRAVCTTDIGDRWVFRHTDAPVDVGGAYGVLGMSWDIEPDEWRVRWTTERTVLPGDDNPLGWFTVDLSALDGPDVLAPSFTEPDPIIIPIRDE